MSKVDQGVFGKAIDKTRVWVEELRRELGEASEADAYHALRATLQVLRERLPLSEVADLSAQLPTQLRGLFLQGWCPASEPKRIRHEWEFLTEVQKRRGRKPIDARLVVTSVFKVLEKHVSWGEISDIKQVFPLALLGLWPQGVAAEVERAEPSSVMEHAIGQFLSRDVVTIQANATLEEALEIMSHARLRHLLVLTSGSSTDRIHERSIAGMLSNRDALSVMQRYPDSDVRLEWLLVRDVMSHAPLETIGPTASLREAAKIMHERKFSALPVIEDKYVVGILTSDDLLFAVSIRAPSTVSAD